MQIILSQQCLSLAGCLGRDYGYFIVKRKNGFFSVRSKYGAPPDGHWRFILVCAELAQSGLYISDISVKRYEVQNAIQEAGWLHLIHAVDFKGMLNAADILAFKERFSL